MSARKASRRKGGWTAGKCLWLAFWGAVAAGAAYLLWLPDVKPLKTKNPTTTAYIELRKQRAAKQGKKFNVRMVWAGYDQISEHLRHAVLTAEDGAFYRHKGVDWENMRVALEKDIKLRRFAYGGSTITQQLARNLYLSPSKNPLRKVKEFLIARRLENALGKRRILELYLNVAEWGNGIYGAEAASEAYFGKHASELTPEEAMAMAVVLPSPRKHDPSKKGRYVQRNMERISRRMKARGMLPADEEVVDEEAEEDADDVGEEYTLETSTRAASLTAESSSSRAASSHAAEAKSPESTKASAPSKTAAPAKPSPAASTVKKPRMKWPKM